MLTIRDVNSTSGEGKSNARMVTRNRAQKVKKSRRKFGGNHSPHVQA